MRSGSVMRVRGGRRERLPGQLGEELIGHSGRGMNLWREAGRASLGELSLLIEPFAFLEIRAFCILPLILSRNYESCPTLFSPQTAFVRLPILASERERGDFDCGWSLLSHGVAERKRLNLGNLNPIYERDLTKLDVHQMKGRWNVSKDGAWRKGCRHR